MTGQSGTELGLGGGCHWCTEAVFDALRGAENVEQGFIASEPPHDSFSEAVRLRWDEEVLPLEVLIEIHLRTHASTSAHKMRGKYRSAIYVPSKVMAERCQATLAGLAPQFEDELVTQVLPLGEFRLSDERFRQYYQTRPDAPFCQTYIDPKLALLRQEYADRL